MATVHRIGFTRLARDTTEGDQPHHLNVIFVHGLRGHPQSTWEDEVKTGDGTSNSGATPRRRRLPSLPFRTKRSKSNVINNTANNEAQLSRRIFWPRDYLIDDLPEARLWTYGYNADVIGGMFEANNQNSVSQHGRDLAVKFERDIDNQVLIVSNDSGMSHVKVNRLTDAQDPVVFVAHSLGGIIVKDALHRSDACRLRTKFIVFLGTPHRGSSYADWRAIVTKLAGLALQDFNQELLNAMQVNGEVLDNIQSEFQRIVQSGSIRIHSFQEARGLSGIKGLEGKVVSDFSSKIGLAPPLEIVESIDANHVQMARCTDKDDPQYRAILGVLKQLIRDSLGNTFTDHQTTYLRQDHPSERISIAHKLGTADPTAHQSVYHIRLEENPRFTGRSNILDELEERLLVRKECRIMALAGLGGVGKTQVALQFAYRVKNDYPEYSIFWVAALSAGTFEQAYTEIANKLGVQRSINEEDIKDALCQHLSSKKAGRWLLVIDNADHPEMVFGSATIPGIINYLPSNKEGLTLLTTRSREVAVDFAQSDVLDIEKMDPEESRAFLEKLLVRKETLQDEALVSEFLDNLAHLPLAIVQAAAFLNQNKTTIARYLQLLKGAESEVTKLFSREFRDKTRYKGSYNAVARTWLVSFEQIQHTNQGAVDLLAFLSCIEPKAIPQSILPNHQSFETESAVGMLCGYSFLAQRGDSETFDMHSLVHMAARMWTDEQGETESVLKKAICHLGDIFPSNDWPNRDMWRRYLPHAFRILDKSKGYQLQDRYNLAGDVGYCLDTDRRFKEAIRYFKEVYEWKREQFSDEKDHNRLTSEHSLAKAYLDDRQVDKAIEMFEHIVAIRKEALDEKDHSRLVSEHELARAYLADKQIKKAIEMFEHIVAIWKETLDETDHSRLASEHTLARAYLDDKQIKKAIEMFEHVVAIRKETLDETDHSRLASEHELARAYLADSQARKAVSLLEHVVAIKRQSFNEDDPERQVSLDLLQDAYGRLEAEGQTLGAESDGSEQDTTPEAIVL